MVIQLFCGVAHRREGMSLLSVSGSKKREREREQELMPPAGVR
jgi:hypothetical protein